MRAETIFTEPQTNLDLHQEVAALLPPPASEDKPHDPLFPDTPMFSAILAEHKYTVTSELPALFEDVAEMAAVTEIQQESPLLAEILVARPQISAQNVLEAVKAAKQAETTTPAPAFGWFEAYDRPGPRPSARQEQLPPPWIPEAPRRPVRPSATAVWQLSGELGTRLATPGDSDVVPTTQPRQAAAQPVATAMAPKPVSLFKTLRTKIATGWRRLTTKNSKPYVPAIPNWQ